MIESLHGDAASLVVRVGLPLAVLDNDEILVRDTSIAALLELAAAELDCADFGLRVALEQNLDLLGPLALAVGNSETIGEALDCTSRYLFVHARGLSVAAVPDPYLVRGVIAYRYGYPPGVYATPQSVDMGLLFLHRAITDLAGGPYGLRSVEIPHAPVAHPERYESLFGVNAVRYRRSSALLRVPKHLAEQPISGRNRSAHELALRFLQQQPNNGTTTLTTQVKTYLRRTLGTIRPTLDATASEMSMAPRSLQRQLRAEGSSFGACLDETRRERAEHYLRTTRMPVGQVAAVIGLDSPASLSRYADRWWHTTPRRFRLIDPAALSAVRSPGISPM
ncbi:MULTISPECIES: AraC family transcriptional regulator ligand-binding domain-containing protein [Nocardiaceae]|uniref:AraC-like DNA-binding protein n=1 Tax=Rhodococcoides corynebacterioides TaxID=53972 RepID=A0ABS2KV35_9NOCA|nr:MULTISPECIES: AraC family transcriptional regulator ligand-binding domain-containing protein [Rhodococcus]MBM7415475.1 AraC-like DNA-binding protein [Rhodococcus corynebacterioides]MBP1117937.1 AraC-like DNA-binding protein [Rhodococcus sp. PvP016]